MKVIPLMLKLGPDLYKPTCVLEVIHC